MSDEEEERQLGLAVVYCPHCGLPPDFCDYGDTPSKCKPWLQSNHPAFYQQLFGDGYRPLPTDDVPTKEMGALSVRDKEAAKVDEENSEDKRKKSKAGSTKTTKPKTKTEARAKETEVASSEVVDVKKKKKKSGSTKAPKSKKDEESEESDNKQKKQGGDTKLIATKIKKEHTQDDDAPRQGRIEKKDEKKSGTTKPTDAPPKGRVPNVQPPEDEDEEEEEDDEDEGDEPVKRIKKKGGVTRLIATRKSQEAWEAAQAAAAAEITIAEAEDEESGPKKKKTGLVAPPSGKYIYLSTVQRNKKKCITEIRGLYTYGLKEKVVASAISKKFGCGASIVKGEEPEIQVQGDVLIDLPSLLVSQFEIPAEDIFIVKGTKKTRAT